MLKLREVAKRFYKKEVGNGRHISFWYDNWSDMGVMHDLLGDRGLIDMGIRKEATLAEAAWSFRRRRRHRTEVLNEVEENLNSVREKLSEGSDDMCLWRGMSSFKSSFSTKETWLNLRTNTMQLKWPRGVWYSMATPRFAFIVWLAMQNRLSTMDRVARWSQGVDVKCVLCNNDVESRDHLFFRCTYSAQLWYSLVGGILGSAYTENWATIVKEVSEGSLNRIPLFCLRYTFHVATYYIWRERNSVKHGEKLMHINMLKKFADKCMRNKLSLVRLKGKKGMEDVLCYWFQSRV
ncbi:uncharacterized protein LOC108832079 [Raphanus sativus]|uniref:Uncharacterized protein LOC108832079 n=1 Tax=Raphanus sativus TaxID=3726 RepID=A0A6J0LLF2_RAPSA|nr:uncharacterized protein LOC108832079 [Raphanus sativus]